MTADLPTLGAALNASSLESHRDWILADQRDVEIQDFVSAELLDGDWQAVAARVRTLLDGHTGRRGIHGPFMSLDIGATDPAIREVVSRRMVQGLEVCEVIGATCMVIHSPYRTWDYNNLDLLPNARANRIAAVHETLGAVVRRAEDTGVVLVIENIEDKDPADRRALAESFGSPAVRLSIDTGHAYYAERSTGAPPVDYFVTSAGEMLEHVHLQDADGYADRHWAPGEGSLNWTALFAAVGRLPQRPRLMLELRDHTRIRSGAAYLQNLGLAR